LLAAAGVAQLVILIASGAVRG